MIAVVFDGRVDIPGAEPLSPGASQDQVRDASEAGFRAGMVVAAVLAFGGAAVGGLGISNADALGGRRVSGEQRALEAQ